MPAIGNNYLKFPIDLADNQHGHFMKISIYPSGALGGSNPVTPDFSGFGLFENVFTATGTLAQSLVQSNPNPNMTICLFIPGGGNGGPLQWEMVHDYDEVKLTRLGMGIIGGVTRAAVQAGIGAARLLGQGTINPKVDVLYSNSQLRKFMFSYFMAPSSQQENDSMKTIIKALRKYSAPELTLGGAENQQSAFRSGFWFIPPAEFEIQFYHTMNGGWRENTSIPKIGRCVLERIDVNYTQQGEFSTFIDGSPTTAQLTMQFREMRIVSQADVENGY